MSHFDVLEEALTSHHMALYEAHIGRDKVTAGRDWVCSCGGRGIEPRIIEHLPWCAYVVEYRRIEGARRWVAEMRAEAAMAESEKATREGEWAQDPEEGDR